VTTRSTASYVGPVLLALAAILAVSNWWLRPERAWAWAICLLLIGFMSLVWRVSSRRDAREAASTGWASSPKGGVVFAGLMLVVSLGAKLAGALGAAVPSDLSFRAVMVILGGFLVLTGNALPKTLTPLKALRCDPASAQAFQRFAGWAWVLTGLTFAGAWLLLPFDLAQPVSTALLLGGMLAIAARLFRLQRPRRHEA
jgi:hypothetical protein